MLLMLSLRCAPPATRTAAISRHMTKLRAATSAECDSRSRRHHFMRPPRDSGRAKLFVRSSRPRRRRKGGRHDDTTAGVSPQSAVVDGRHGSDATRNKFLISASSAFCTREGGIAGWCWRGQFPRRLSHFHGHADINTLMDFDKLARIIGFRFLSS